MPDVHFVSYSERTLSVLREQGFRSQFGQDHFLLKSGLVENTGGRFIEVGCNMPETASNSWYFERHREFAGLAIDPLAQYQDAWNALRPNTVFIPAFVSVRKEPVQFVETTGGDGWESMLSGAADSINLTGNAAIASRRFLQPVSLVELLQGQGWGFDVDVLFVDVEGHEREVLDSADWSGSKPRVLVIENTGPLSRQTKMRKFVESLGYCLNARISIYDDVYVSDECQLE
jgi:hypothetical protein